jgi:hypothetical protein
MIKKILILTAVLLSGCANTEPEKVAHFDTTTLDTSLKGSLASIDQAIKVLAFTKNALAVDGMKPDQVKALRMQVNAMPRGMEIPLTHKTYYGELEPIVRRIAMMTDYEFIVIGKRADIGVMVKVASNGRSAYDVIYDVGTQAGTRATVYVIPFEEVDPEGKNGLVKIEYKGF